MVLCFKDTPRKVEAADIEHIAQTMRESDVMELRDGLGMTPKEALLNSVASSLSCKTLDHQGVPCAIGGVCESGRRGLVIAWLLANDNLQKSVVALTRYLPPLLEHWGKTWGTLANFVDARNKTSIGWLERLGFRIAAEDPQFGRAKIPFLWMVKGKSRCVPEVFRSVCSVPLAELGRRSHRATQPTPNSLQPTSGNRSKTKFSCARRTTKHERDAPQQS